VIALAGVIAVTAQTSYQWVDLSFGGGEGEAIAATAGVHTDATTIVGFRLSASRTTGLFSDTFTPPTPYSYLAIVPAAYAHGEAADVVWADVYVGASIDAYKMSGTNRDWTVGTCVGLVGGIDVWKTGPHRVSLIGQVESELSGDSHEGLALGVAYRFR
jgi:hypothetical protein